MRAAFPLIILTLATGAAAEPVAPTPAPDTQLTLPEGRVPCRDTIQNVRAERGLPQLQREAAVPNEPLLIAAVDHRLGGCSVMVMYNDTSDVRALPTAREGSPLLQRIPGG